MILTKEQKRLLKLASHQVNGVLKDAEKQDSNDIAWRLWFAYDAVSNVYHQIRDAALDEKSTKETK